MNIFLAFAFRDVDKPLVGYMDRLLASQFVQSKTGENLGGERLLARVAAVQQDQPLAGVRRRHAGEQVQEVVDHDGIELLAGDEDHAGARPAQQHEHVEHALFVVVDAVVGSLP